MFDTRSGLSFFASLKDAAGAAVLGSDQKKIGSGSALEVAAPQHCSLYIIDGWVLFRTLTSPVTESWCPRITLSSLSRSHAGGQRLRPSSKNLLFLLVVIFLINYYTGLLENRIPTRTF